MNEPPRLRHNRDLAAAYIGDRPRWPKVSEQVECLPLDLGKLHKNAYNPTIIERNGSLFMAYRYHEGTLASKLAVAYVADNGAVRGNHKLDLVGHSLEDPKFFQFGSGELWMSWVEAYWPVKAVGSVRYGGFKGESLHEAARPVYGQNDGDHLEKSWVFFERGGELYFIYQSSPKQVIVRWSGKIEGEYVTPGPHWPYGEIKGGTPPIPYEGKLLRFFHSTLENEIDLPRREYYCGACLMNPEPPFEVVQVSRKPILYGSLADGLTAEDRQKCIHWKPKVVFPGGAVERDGHWVLSVGVNDSAIDLCKINPQQLNF